MKKKKKKVPPFLLCFVVICLLITVIEAKIVKGIIENDKKATKTTTEKIDTEKILSQQKNTSEVAKNLNSATKPAEEKALNSTDTQSQESTQPKADSQSNTVQANGLPVNTSSGTKVAYLTFDDGPSTNNTPLVLDTLKKENVNATFFVIGSMAEKNPSLVQREKDEGNAIGNHTYSHGKSVYANTTSFLNDFKKGDEVITSIIGNHDSHLIRFPGGSYNRTSYKKAAEENGYHYYDWNCLTGDAEVSLASTDRLMRRFKETYTGQDQLVILMHDAPAKTTTPTVLPQIIDFLKSQGYTFKTLE